MGDNTGRKVVDPSPNESQSTQIMNFALGVVAPVQPSDERNVDPVIAGNNVQKNGSGNDSTLSGSSSDTSALARLNFHGLANTQTQTQNPDGDFDPDDVPNSNSQKENTPTHIAQQVAPGQAQPLTRSTSNTNKALCKANGQQGETIVTPRADDSNTTSGVVLSTNKGRVVIPETPSLSSKALDQATKSVAFVSPAKQAMTPLIGTKAIPKTRSRRRRSPSLSSQDSFAGPSALQDPDLFLAISKQFDKPLSELGSPKTSSQSQENASAGGPSLEEKEKNVATGGVVQRMTPYSLSSTSSRPLALGRVLVENSDESADPSQGSADSNNSINSVHNFNTYDSSEHPTQLNTSISSDADNPGATQIVPEATQIIDESSQPEPNPSDPAAILPPSLALPNQPPAFHRRNTVSADGLVAHESEGSVASSAISLPPGSILGLASAKRLQKYIKSMGSSGSSVAATTSPVILSTHPVPGIAPAVSVHTPAPVPVLQPPKPLQPVASTSTVSHPSLTTEASTRAVAGSPVVRKAPVLPKIKGKANASSGIQESEQQVEAEISVPSFEQVVTSTQKGPTGTSKTAATRKSPSRTKTEEVIPESISLPSSSAPLATYVQKKRKAAAEPLDAVSSPMGSEKDEPEHGPESEGELLKKAPKGKTTKPASAAKGKGKAKPTIAQSRKTARSAQSKFEAITEEEDDGEPAEKPEEQAPARPRRGAPRGKAQKIATPTVPKMKTKVKQEPRPAARVDVRAAAKPVRGGRRVVQAFRQSPATSRGTPKPRQLSVPQTPLEQTAMVNDEEEEEEEAEADDDGGSPDVPLAVGKDAEVATEIDEEECLEEDDTESVQLSRKRKRTQSGSEFHKSIYGSTSRSCRSSVLSVGGPQNKRAKNHSFMKGQTPATRVFALWKAHNLYYAGTIYSIDKESSTKFIVKFDDQTQDSVDIKKIRRCELKVGDEIIDADTKMRCLVTDVSEWTLRGSCKVEVQDDDKNIIELESSKVTIAARTLLAQWADRVLQINDIIPQAGRKALRGSASPSRASIIRPFSRIGFVITLGPGNTGWEQERDRLINTINEAGGTVINDWSDIFTLEGRHEYANKRWIITENDLEYVPVEDVESVFLLAEIMNRKPKYLIALALGIPCVSIEWLESQSLQPRMEWHKYLLPAGLSDHLDARITQMVDLDWGNSMDHLRGIARSQVPHKLLKGNSVLCVGSELMPLPRKKNGAESDKTIEASRWVPRIALAMGASRVEAVADVRNASEKDLSNYDYVIMKGELPRTRLPRVRYVNVTWIKECLVAGRLLPIDDL